jgi:hypothetical protein
MGEKPEETKESHHAARYPSGFPALREPYATQFESIVQSTLLRKHPPGLPQASLTTQKQHAAQENIRRVVFGGRQDEWTLYRHPEDAAFVFWASSNDDKHYVVFDEPRAYGWIVEHESHGVTRLINEVLRLEMCILSVAVYAHVLSAAPFELSSGMTLPSHVIGIDQQGSPDAELVLKPPALRRAINISRYGQFYR